MIKKIKGLLILVTSIMLLTCLVSAQQKLGEKVEQGATNIFGVLLIPFMVLLIVIGLLVTIRVVAKRYKKIPPNSVGVFFGRQYSVKRPDGKVEKLGFRIIGGGGKVLLPIIEEYYEMDTSVFQVKLEEHDIPNIDNVKLNVGGIATCKISALPEDLENAARSFLKKRPEEIQEITRNILLGHLRSIVGKMSVESIIRDRDVFNTQVANESKNELKNIGIEVKTLVIQNFSDDAGYINALGMGKTAEVKREARIRVAQAERDATIGEAEALREKTIKKTNADREAAVVAADNAAQIAQAERDRDMKKANYKAEVDTQVAKSDQAGPLSHAEAIKAVKVATAKAEEAEKEAQTEVQKKEALRREQELTATILKSAEINKQAEITQSEGRRQAAINIAEGQKEAKRMEGEGEGAKTAAILEGDAKGKAAQLELQGKAEGAATMAKLVGEAQGLLKKAEALEKLDKTGRLITLMEKLPPVAAAIGQALSEVAREVFQGIGAPLGSVDKIQIVDFGSGNNPSGDSGLTRYATLVPTVLMSIIAKAKAGGLDLGGILKKLGIDPTELINLITTEPSTAESKESKKPSSK